MRVEADTKEDRAVGIVPSAPWRVETVEALPGFRFRVRFVDGLEGVVDVRDLAFSRDAGVFSALRDPGLFSKVYVELGAVTWPGEIDLAPDAMYEAIKNHGEWRVPV